MNELELLMKALAQQPVVMVQKPDNELRQKVWYETYSASLKKGLSMRHCITLADSALNEFDKLFTQKTVL